MKYQIKIIQLKFGRIKQMTRRKSSRRIAFLSPQGTTPQTPIRPLLVVE
ncbi:hypothetical protein ACVBGC_28375 [Burkholderia stagnalis]